MAHKTLHDYYRLSFELKEYNGGGKYSFEEIDDMFPYELELTFQMIRERIQERRDAAQQK